jgi:hypothetical protein
MPLEDIFIKVVREGLGLDQGQSGPPHRGRAGGARRAGERTMSFSWKKTFTIAQREYLTTVRRKAFLFTIFGTPAL